MKIYINITASNNSLNYEYHYTSRNNTTKLKYKIYFKFRYSREVFLINIVHTECKTIKKVRKLKLRLDASPSKWNIIIIGCTFENLFIFLSLLRDLKESFNSYLCSTLQNVLLLFSMTGTWLQNVNQLSLLLLLLFVMTPSLCQDQHDQ